MQLETYCNYSVYNPLANFFYFFCEVKLLSSTYSIQPQT